MTPMKRYSIVCYLEGDELTRVRQLQQKLTDLTGSRKCIDSWMPHLTLGSGIVVSDEEQARVESLFEDIVRVEHPFEIKLEGFGGTEQWTGAREGITTPYVLWIDPVKTDELQHLFETIRDRVTDGFDTFYPRIVEYIPHVTVAYGDLTKEGYEAGRRYLADRGFTGLMFIDHVALVENFDDKDVEYKRFYLKG